MSVPYLNRGETIALTTHRVSVGSIQYDAMLTNQRLILMDSSSDQSEPEIIPFTEIVTVKGGKASTGEPAIILTLNEPNNFSDSGQASLIFSQTRGEKRKHERELWVKKLIELVIKAREQDAQSRIAPPGKKIGLQPSVRRWEAPEPVRPHSSVAEPVPPAVEPVVITEQEPDPLEFFLEETGRKSGAASQTSGKKSADIIAAPVAEAPDAKPTPAFKKSDDAEPVPPAQQPEPENPPVERTIPKDPFAGIHISPPPPEPQQEQEAPLPKPELIGRIESKESFDSIVRAAAESLHMQKDTAPVPEPESALVREQAVRKTSPLPERRAEESNAGLPVHLTPGEKRELPGTYSPAIPAPVISTGSQDAMPEPQPPTPGGKPLILTAVIAIIFLILLIGGIVVAMNYIQGSVYTNTVVTISPSATSSQEVIQQPADQQQTGVRVRVIYPGLFTGTIGNPGYLRQVSGTGNRTFVVTMKTGIVQANIRKPDYNGDPLTVEIYNNSTLLASRTVTAPMSEVDLLIDTKSAIPPGLSPDAASVTEKPLLGNGSLVYY